VGAGLGGRLASVQRSSTFTVEALASVLDPKWIAEALEATKTASKRVRALPATLVMWLVVAMSLHRGQSIQNVLFQLAKGLGMKVRWKGGKAPKSPSVTKARDRLGFESVRHLFRTLAGKLQERHAEAHLWKGLPTYALDGTCFLAPDTKENDAWFGRPKSWRGKSAFPQLRAVVLLGAWSHIALAVVFGPYSTGELTLAGYLLPQIDAGALLLMDRGYYSFAWMASLLAKNAHFLIRAKTGKTAMRPKKRTRLGPRDWLADLDVPHSAWTKDKTLPRTVRVRVVTYQKRGFQPAELVTTLLDPVAYPADELVLLYHGRWEAELGYDELKTHLLHETVAFRSKKPARVLQEAYGLLIAYNVVRALMARAAEAAGVEPRRLSFVDCLERIRHALVRMASATARRLPSLYEELLAELAATVLRARRPDRVYPRAVKIKMSNFPLKANQVGRGRVPRKRSA